MRAFVGMEWFFSVMGNVIGLPQFIGRRQGAAAWCFSAHGRLWHIVLIPAEPCWEAPRAHGGACASVWGSLQSEPGEDGSHWILPSPPSPPLLATAVVFWNSHNPKNAAHRGMNNHAKRTNWLEHGASNTKVMGVIPIWAIYLRWT